MNAVTMLLAEHPDREPSTRELYETAGVAAPTLYHHFGTKEGLLEAVVEDAFSGYLERKREMLRTGDLLADFAAGWDLHVDFGVENPVLYALMYGAHPSRAAATADLALRHGLERLADAGLLRVGVDEAAALTTAMAIGCVTQLNRGGGSPRGPLAQAMRAALLSEITGQPRQRIGQDQAARSLLAQLDAESKLFTPAETSLLRQWLRALAADSEQQQAAPGSNPASPTLRQKGHNR